jgi:hypothetical protein
MITGPHRLLRRTTCPHCWTIFPAEDILWVSAHVDLLGDSRLGPEQHQRFLPTRFDIEGNALDAKGFICRTLACPHCHLPVPRALLEMEPFFVSILGAPACGKSYFLTALTWELRNRVAKQFGLALADADPVSNRSLTEYEEMLFLNPRADDLIPLADLIRKTELQGELYDTVMFGNQNVSYPRPFMFTVQPQSDHPKLASGQKLSRVLCLYDNAGEHFHAGQDLTSSPVTQHLAHSSLLFFLFDPLQDQRFRQACKPTTGSGARDGGRSSRQESILQEAAARVRRYTNLPHAQKHNRPLFVVVTKLDTWAHLLKDSSLEEPWSRTDWVAGLDLDRVEKRSQEVRELMIRVSPEIVTAAEGFSERVVYVPVSALGQRPVLHPQTNGIAIRPREIRPAWVAVPLLYGLYRGLSGLITGLRRKQPQTGSSRATALPRTGPSADQ